MISQGVKMHLALPQLKMFDSRSLKSPRNAKNMKEYELPHQARRIIQGAHALSGISKQ